MDLVPMIFENLRDYWSYSYLNTHGFRGWIAYRLARASTRVHSTFHHEAIVVRNAKGDVVARWGIVCDGYGAGLTSRMLDEKKVPRGWSITDSLFDDTELTRADCEQYAEYDRLFHASSPGLEVPRSRADDF
jgi:hypothetical protein